jgi:hypothetical protein
MIGRQADLGVGGSHCELGSVNHRKLAAKGRNVNFDGDLTEAQVMCDLFVGRPRNDVIENLTLPFRQIG